MLSFKDFTKAKSRVPAVFMQAGGRKSKNLIGQQKSLDIPAVYMNAGGPRNSKKIQESVETQHVTTKGRVLIDPAADNTGVGSEANDHEKLIKAPTNGSFSGRTFPHLTDLQAKHYKALADGTDHEDPDYKSHVEKYTNGSEELNSHLYHAHVNKYEPDPEVGGIKIKTMDHLIDKHRTPHDMTVYTGPHFNPEEYAGKEVEAPAYTSTSLSPHVAKDFGVGNHILRIHVPKGHPHLFMDHESCFQGQAETVLPRNTRFKIAEKPSHIVSGKYPEHFDDTGRYPESYSIWDAHILPKDQ